MPCMVCLAPARSLFTRTISSLSAPDFRSVAMVLSASEYTLVTRKVSPVPSFFHSCPIWIFDTLVAIFRLYLRLRGVSTGSPRACIVEGKPVVRLTGRAAFHPAVFAAAAAVLAAAGASAWLWGPASASFPAVAADAVRASGSAAGAGAPSAGAERRSPAAVRLARAAVPASAAGLAVPVPASCTCSRNAGRTFDRPSGFRWLADGPDDWPSAYRSDERRSGGCCSPLRGHSAGDHCAVADGFRAAPWLAGGVPAAAAWRCSSGT